MFGFIANSIYKLFISQRFYIVGGDSFVSVQRPRKSARNRCYRVCIFTEIHGFEHARFIVVGREQTPKRGFERMHYVPAAFDFVSWQVFEIGLENSAVMR